MMKRVGSSTDWSTSKRMLPGSRTDASWFARIESMKASRCSGFTWIWTRVTYIGVLERLARLSEIVRLARSPRSRRGFRNQNPRSDRSWHGVVRLRASDIGLAARATHPGWLGSRSPDRYTDGSLMNAVLQPTEQKA